MACAAGARALPIALIPKRRRRRAISTLGGPGTAPADLPVPSRPTVGFVGALYEWIDWKLIRTVARCLPQFEFVAASGRPIEAPRRRRLTGLPNVHLLRPRPYERGAGVHCGV